MGLTDVSASTLFFNDCPHTRFLLSSPVRPRQMYPSSAHSALPTKPLSLVASCYSDDPKSAPETRSVLERVMMQACPVDGPSLPDMDVGVGADGESRGIASADADARAADTMNHVIPTPAECDHSSVELRPAGASKRVHTYAGGGKRGRWKGNSKGHCRAATNDSQQQQQQKQKQVHPGVEGVSCDNSVADNADRGAQPDVGGGRPGAKGEQSERDVQIARTSSSCSIDHTLDVPSGGGAAHDEVDTVVLNAMGFCNFGGSRG